MSQIENETYEVKAENFSRTIRFISTFSKDMQFKYLGFQQFEVQ